MTGMKRKPGLGKERDKGSKKSQTGTFPQFILFLLIGNKVAPKKRAQCLYSVVKFNNCSLTHQQYQYHSDDDVNDLIQTSRSGKPTESEKRQRAWENERNSFGE